MQNWKNLHELRGKHITKSGIKYQYHMVKIRSKVMQETSQKNTQSTQISRKNYHTFLINFKHVRMSQNNRKRIKKHIAIF